MSLLCFALFTPIVQNVKAENEYSPAELQEQAKELSKKWNGDDFRRSISLFSKAFEGRKKVGEMREASECLRSISHIQTILGNYTEAEKKIKEALKIENNFNILDGKIKSLAILGVIYLKIGKIAESEKYSGEAVALSKSINDSKPQAAALFGAGQVFYFRRQIDKSIEAFRAAVELYDKNGDSEGKANALYELGYSYMSKSKPLEGVKCVKESLSLFEEINDIRGAAFAKIALGHLNNMMDESQTALDSYKSAEVMFPSDSDFYEHAILYNGIGTIYEDYGELNLSLNYRQKAMNLLRMEKHLFGQLATLPSLGSINYRLGNKQTALDYLSQGKQLAERLNDKFFLAVIFEEFGNIYFSENSNDKALENFENSLHILDEIGYKKETEIMTDKIGTIYYRKGEIEKAFQFYEKSLSLSQEIQNKFSQVTTLNNLAILNDAIGKSEIALQQTEQVLSLIESLSDRVININLKKTYFSNIYKSYELYIKLLMKKYENNPAGGTYINALQAAEKSRARVMLENLSFSETSLRKDAADELVKRQKEIRISLNTNADNLTDLLGQNAEKDEIDKISSELDRLENELENINTQIKQQSPIYSAIKNPAPFDVENFQSEVLDNDSLLLEFSLGNQESYLWMVGKNEIFSYVLAPREEIETKVEILRGLLDERKLKDGESVEDFQRRIAEAETRYNRVSKELSGLIFGQVAEKIGNKRLIIIADGELQYFPLAALPNPNLGEPIVLTNETVYAPSAQTLALLAKIRPNSSTATKDLLIFSDPVFTSDDTRFAPGSQTFEKPKTSHTDSFRFVESLNNLPRLSASKYESEAIIDILGKSNSHSYSGFAATRENLLNLKADDYKILHFATHGLANEIRPELSGFVLSRYDENGQQLNEFFRIQDIYALNLNADLVVLSACETGIGKDIKGEGLMSLNNAFLQTGAKSVMASLWKVEDAATLELMKHFYAAMVNEKLTPSQSLRKAQIKLRENPQYKSPFYWAAFTIQGDFKSTPQLHTGTSDRFYCFLATTFLLILFYLLRLFLKNQIKLNSKKTS